MRNQDTYPGEIDRDTVQVLTDQEREAEIKRLNNVSENKT